MYRVLTIAALTIAGSTATADVAPPPGQKRVPIDYIFVTEIEFKDYIFFAVVGGDAEWTKRLEIKPGTPAKLPGAGRGGRARLGWLIAVPAAAEKDYKSEAEFKAAAIDKKIPGTLQSDVGLDSFTVIAETDKRTVIERKYRIEKLDEKKGIVLIPDERKEPDVKKPDGLSRGEIIAGCFAALGLAGLGIWLVRRGRGEWMK